MEQQLLTAESVVQWILKNRRSGAFKDFSVDDIRQKVLKALDNGEIIVDVNNKGEIFGVVIFHKILHVEQILVNNPFSFRNLIQSLYSRFPGFKAQANRCGKLRKYYSSILYKKVMKD